MNHLEERMNRSALTQAGAQGQAEGQVQALKRTKKAKKSKKAEDPSLTIKVTGIVDKDGDEHESTIPRRMYGVPVKTRCSVRISYPVMEYRNGASTAFHEELVHVSEEGTVTTSWNAAREFPETEIHIPPFVIPLRMLYVSKPLPRRTLRDSFDSDYNMTDDEDEPDIANSFGLAEKYMLYFRLEATYGRVWPPLGLEDTIFHNSAIGKELKRGEYSTRDLRIVSETELLPGSALSAETPIGLMLGFNRQTVENKTLHLLTFETAWQTPQLGLRDTTDPILKLVDNPLCIWRVELNNGEGQGCTETSFDDYTCALCFTKVDNIKSIFRHLRDNHDSVKFQIRDSTELPPYIITIQKPPEITFPSDGTPTLPRSKPVNGIIVSTENSNPPTATQLPLSIMAQKTVEHAQEKRLSTSAEISDMPSKMSSPNTSPDPCSRSSSTPPRPAKRRRRLSISGALELQKDKDSADEDDGNSQVEENLSEITQHSTVEESAGLVVLVPKTAKPLYDIATRRVFKPGEPLPLSTVSWDWRIRRHQDMTNDYIDITDEEKDFMNQWDSYMMRQRQTSMVYLPMILKDFITINTTWFAEQPCRKKEFAKHLIALAWTRRIDRECLKDCLRMFQTGPLRNSSSFDKSTLKTSTKYRNWTAADIEDEENGWMALWDKLILEYRKDKYVVTDNVLKACDAFIVAAGNARTENNKPFNTHQNRIRSYLSANCKIKKHVPSAKQFLRMANVMCHDTTEDEKEYERYFEEFKGTAGVGKGGMSHEKLLHKFFTSNTMWFVERPGRIEPAKFQLQELHWDDEITLEFRAKSLNYLEKLKQVEDAEEETVDGDKEMVDADAVDLDEEAQESRHENKGKGTESLMIKQPFPPPTENDLIQGPREAKHRAADECSCGEPVHPAHMVACAADTGKVRIYHLLSLPFLSATSFFPEQF